MAIDIRTRGGLAGSKTLALSPLQPNSYPNSKTSNYTISGEKIPEAEGHDERQRNEGFLTLARERFKLCYDAELKRRGESLLDFQFRCGNQWRPDIKALREQKQRPCPEVNRIPEFLNHVVNNMRQSRPAIAIDPVGDGADEKQAEVRQGLIQYIERNSQADIAYDHSFEDMCTGGLGWIRVLDDWASWDSFDKDLFIRWVENTFAVYSDPNVALPDWSDMQFLFNVEDMLPNEFKARYGEDRMAGQPGIFADDGNVGPYWFPNGKIRVAEYYYIEQEDDTLCEDSTGATSVLSKLNKNEVLFKSEDDRLLMKVSGDGEDEEEEWKDVGRTRPCTVPTVKWAKITALDVLEERVWKGRFIPFIPVIGQQVMLEGERIIIGMVRFAREIQRMYNYIWSRMVEVIALTPISQWVAEIGQIEDFRDVYETANTDPQAVLPYKASYNPNGAPIPPPQRVGTEVQIQGLIQALTITDNMLKSVFNIYDASLGQRGPQESGRAIDARKIESETSTYNWGDNFIRSLRHLGIVVNDLLEYYYNTPGRQVQILREDQTAVEIRMQDPNFSMPGSDEPLFIDLSKGKYGVTTSTGPSFPTLRKEAANGMLEILKANPQLFQVFGDLFVKEQDWPGKDAIAARIAKTLPPALQDPEDGQKAPDPQVVQLQGMVQQLTQALHAATDKTMVEKMKQEYETFREAMRNQTDLISADLKASMQGSQFLADKLFNEMEQIRQLFEAKSDPAAQPVQPGQQPNSPAVPVTPSGPVAVGGQ